MSFFVAVGAGGEICALWNILFSFGIKSRCVYEGVEKGADASNGENHPLLVDDNLSLSLQVRSSW